MKYKQNYEKWISLPYKLWKGYYYRNHNIKGKSGKVKW